MKKLNGVTDNLIFLVWSWTILSISWTISPNDHASTAVWGILFTGLVAHNLISTAIRYRKIRGFAAEKNFTRLGNSLPRNLLMARTSFGLEYYSIINCIVGEVRGVSLAIFDLSHRSGKRRNSQTIVAFPRKGPHAIPEPPIDFVGCYRFEAAGDWIIAWIPRRIVKVEELEDWCVELHTLARDLLAEAKGESGTRPRLFRWLT